MPAYGAPLRISLALTGHSQGGKQPSCHISEDKPEKNKSLQGSECGRIIPARGDRHTIIIHIASK